MAFDDREYLYAPVLSVPSLNTTHIKAVYFNSSITLTDTQYDTLFSEWSNIVIPHEFAITNKMARSIISAFGNTIAPVAHMPGGSLLTDSASVSIGYNSEIAAKANCLNGRMMSVVRSTDSITGEYTSEPFSSSDCFTVERIGSITPTRMLLIIQRISSTAIRVTRTYTDGTTKLGSAFDYASTSSALSIREIYEAWSRNGLEEENPNGDDPFTPNIDGPGSPSSINSGGDGTGGGWGNFDYSSDGPQDKNPPTVSTYDAGFCTLYAATQAQIKALADYMWADTGDFINNWNKLWANPMDAILGISLVPLSGLLTGVSAAVKVGNIATSVYMTRLASSIVRVDCGSLYITSQSLSHSFMDFPPYNQVELYLPYIGTVSISASDVIDKYLSISYLCDCLSGSCVAFVMSSGYTVATYSGNIAAAVPVTSGDFANIVFAALDYLKVGGQDVAAGIGGIMASKGGGLKGARGIAETVSAGASLVEHTFEIGQSILVPQITKGGPAGSTAGYMNHQKPFLIFNAPNVAAPENMNTYIGYAQYETKSLGSCRGFTKVAEIHYRGAGTEIERAEIENLLRMGVDL